MESHALGTHFALAARQRRRSLYPPLVPKCAAGHIWRSRPTASLEGGHPHLSPQGQREVRGAGRAISAVRCEARRGEVGVIG